MNDNPWAYWQAALAGEKPQMNEGNPQAGFYRWPKKAGYQGKRSFTPIAYWEQDGKVMCRIGDEDVSEERGQDVWISVGRHCVTEEAYRAVAELGQPWPDEHELVSMDGSNRAPADDTYEALRDAIEPLATEANRLLAGDPAKTKDEADRITNLADRLSELWDKADALFKEEKTPPEIELKKTRERWTPLLTAALVFKNLKYKLVTPFLLDQTRALAKAKEEAIATGTPVPEVERPKAGTRGRAVSLRTTKSAKIVDRNVVLNFFQNNEEITRTLQSLSDRAVRAGVEVPGTEVLEDTKAV